MSAAYHNKIETDPVYDDVRAVKQIKLQPYTQHLVLANMQSHGLITIGLFDLSRHNTLSARGVMKVSPRKPFYILVSGVSNCKVRL